MIYTRSQKSTTIALIFSIMVAGATLNGAIKPWEPLPVAHAAETPTPTPQNAVIPPPEDGGPIPIDSDGDGKTDGWDVDGDGQIDVPDGNGNGTMDQDEIDQILAFEASTEEQDNQCRIGIRNYGSKLVIIGTALEAAGAYVAAVPCGYCQIIGGILFVVGAILKWLGGRKNYTKELYKVYYLKEYRCDPETRMDATILFQTMANRIMVVINSGGDGTPGTTTPDGRTRTTWITDWHGFVQGQQDLGRKHFRQELYTAALSPRWATMCPYFAEAIAEEFGATPATPDWHTTEYYRIGTSVPFDMQVKCTLPEDFDIDKYLSGEDFSWELYNLVHEPQNNPEGVRLIASAELQRQIDYTESLSREDAVANQGFRGIRDESGTLTPGSVLSKLAADTIVSQLNYAISADEAGELFSESFKMVGLTVNRITSLLNEKLANP